MNKIWPEMFELKNKISVVCGGGGLIGREVSVGLAQAGAKVIIIDLNDSIVKNIIKESKNSKKNLDISFIKADLTKEKSIENVIKKIIKNNKHIDIWINAAYPKTSDWGDKFEKIKFKSLQKNVDMQLNGVFMACQKVSEYMKKRKKGVIINFGSIYGLVGPNFNIYKGTSGTCPAAYSAIKGGIINFTRYLASYLSPYNIRVNAIAPGGIFDNQHRKFVKKYSELAMIGRMANPEEIAGAAIFLSSDAASYITGCVLPVDGGWTAW